MYEGKVGLSLCSHRYWKFEKRCWSHSFIAFARMSGRSSGGRSWNMTFHLVISISTSSGKGRSPMYISTTSWMLVCDPSAQRTGGTRPRIRRAAAFAARGENQLSKSLTMWSKNGTTHLCWYYCSEVSAGALLLCSSLLSWRERGWNGCVPTCNWRAILTACGYTFSNPFSTPARSAL